MSDLIELHLQHCRSRGLSPRTISDRGDVLRRIHADLPWGLYEASVEELENWLAHAGWSAWTRATYYTHVTGFYRWACNPAVADGLDFDPSAALIRPRSPRCVPNPVSDEQLRTIIDYASDPYRLWALLALRAGLRCAEIAALRREHIREPDPNNPDDLGAILVFGGKGGKDRIIDMHPDLWALVRELPPGPIARRADNGLPATAEYVSGSTRHHFRRWLDIPRGGLHRGRHRFGTDAYRLSHDLRAVQEIMGHASIITTQGYTLVTSEERRAVIQALPTLTTTL